QNSDKKIGPIGPISL
ncbi:ion transport family protein, partial [Vibrio parahaemolyticus AQ3810]